MAEISLNSSTESFQSSQNHQGTIWKSKQLLLSPTDFWQFRKKFCTGKDRFCTNACCSLLFPFVSYKYTPCLKMRTVHRYSPAYTIVAFPGLCWNLRQVVHIVCTKNTQFS
jgi:hypothetical protein